jgi:hypothetical protein
LSPGPWRCIRGGDQMFSDSRKESCVL